MRMTSLMAPALVGAAGPITRLITDKVYNTNRLRARLSDRTVEPVIPLSAAQAANPLRRAHHAKASDRADVLRVEDFRRVATRYDKLARNFLAGGMLGAALIHWI